MHNDSVHDEPSNNYDPWFITERKQCRHEES